MWKKLSILLVGKFHEFLFGKTRFLIGFHLLNLWAFVVQFLNRGSTITDGKSSFGVGREQPCGW